MVNISTAPQTYKNDEDLQERRGGISETYFKTYVSSFYLQSPNIGTINTNFMVITVHVLLLTILIYIFTIPVFLILGDIFPPEIFILIYSIIMTFCLITSFLLYISLGNSERYFLTYTDYIYLVTFSLSYLPLTLFLTLIARYLGFIFSLIQFFISYFYISNGIYKVHIIDSFGKSILISIIIFIGLTIFQFCIEGLMYFNVVKSIKSST